jgi:uncharacterized membrane protein
MSNQANLENILIAGAGTFGGIFLSEIITVLLAAGITLA